MSVTRDKNDLLLTGLIYACEQVSLHSGPFLRNRASTCIHPQLCPCLISSAWRGWWSTKGRALNAEREVKKYKFRVLWLQSVNGRRRDLLLHNSSGKWIYFCSQFSSQHFSRPFIRYSNTTGSSIVGESSSIWSPGRHRTRFSERR